MKSKSIILICVLLVFILVSCSRIKQENTLKQNINTSDSYDLGIDKDLQELDDIDTDNSLDEIESDLKDI